MKCNYCLLINIDLAARLPKLFTISYIDCSLKVKTGDIVITYLSPSVKICLTTDCFRKLTDSKHKSLFRYLS